MLKKIRKKLLPVLLDKAEKQQPMTLLEKDFLEESGMEIALGEKKSYNEYYKIELFGLQYEVRNRLI